MSSSGDYEFRLATPKDASQVSHLIGSTWAKFFAYSVTESDLETYLTKTVSEAQIRIEIQDQSKLFLVACRSSESDVDSSSSGQQAGSTIVGVAQLNLKTTESGLTTSQPIELNRLYIDPNEQGSGLASTLLEYAEEQSRTRGYDGMWLGVWENNARAMRFYEKKGFERRGEHWFWVGESQRRDWIMEKSL
jgi:ribosomal protein S18 acetylase RimI-like enzyme